MTRSGCYARLHVPAQTRSHAYKIGDLKLFEPTGEWPAAWRPRLGRGNGRVGGAAQVTR